MKNLIYGVVAFILVVAGLYTYGRWSVYKKCTANPEFAKRLMVKPTDTTFTGKLTEKLRKYDLGYGILNLPEKVKVTLESNSSNVCRILTEDVNICFAPPLSNKVIKKTLDDSLQMPEYTTVSKKSNPNYLDILKVQETASLKTFSEYLFMGGEQFQNEMNLLSTKLMAFGYEKVVFFEAPESRGVIRVGKSQGDKTIAVADVYSKNGKTCQAVSITIPHGKNGDVSDYIEQIFGNLSYN